MRFKQLLVGVSLALTASVVINAAQAVADVLAPGPPRHGTALISGRVVDGRNQTPIEGAVVEITPNGQPRASVKTDDHGQFLLKDLPSGSFTLVSSKDGFFGGQFGQRSATDGIPARLDLADGDTIADVVLQMWPVANLGGRVIGAAGTPRADVPVQLLRRRFYGAELRLERTVVVRTDARGDFTFDTVLPGDYALVVGADAKGGPESSGGQAAYLPVFYPETYSPKAAATLTLAAGETRHLADIAFLPSVGEEVTGATNPATARLPLQLVRVETDGPVTNLISATSETSVGGRFAFHHVPPGDYIIRTVVYPRGEPQEGTWSTSQNGAGSFFEIIDRDWSPGKPQKPLPHAPLADTSWSSTTVSVKDSDVSNVAVNVNTGGRIRGRVVFDGTTRQPTAGELLSATITLLRSDGRDLGGFFPVSRIEADRTFFTVGLLPGPYQMNVGLQGGGWWISKISRNGADLIGATVDVGREDADGLVVTMTDHRSEMTGVVRDAAGAPAPNASIYVFPTDRTQWPAAGTLSSMVREVRSNQRGQYHLTQGSWVGDFFVVAVSDGFVERWTTPAYLEALAKVAETIRRGTPAAQTRDLTARVIK